MDVYKLKDMEETYSNREIREMFGDLQKQLNRIENQTVKTNGRVSNLEQWKSYTAGAVAVILFIGVPILGYLATQVIHIQSVVEAQTFPVMKLKQ